MLSMFPNVCDIADCVKRFVIITIVKALAIVVIV